MLLWLLTHPGAAAGLWDLGGCCRQRMGMWDCANTASALAVPMGSLETQEHRGLR